MEYLADIYGNLIYKIVYSILCKNCDISSVEECTNDVFMKIWNNIDYILYDARVIVPLK